MEHFAVSRKVSLLHKIVVCCLGGTLLTLTLVILGDRQGIKILSGVVLRAVSLTLSVTSVLFVFYWQYSEKYRRADSGRVLGFWQGIVVYCIAFIFFRFGLMKLLGLHMNTSLVYDDMPAGSLSGYALMDYFFGRIPVFKTIIAVLQLAGAACLLYRKTRIIAIATLLPVIVNIALMDYFYSIGGTITIVAIFLSLGLVYLLAQDAARIMAYIRACFDHLPQIKFSNPWAKNAIRVSALLIPLATLLPHYKPAHNRMISGKYNVLQLELNGVNIPVDRNLDSNLTTVYFDENDDCILRYNAYDKLKVGKALFDKSSRRLIVLWRYPKTAVDTLHAFLSEPNNTSQLMLTGTMGKLPVSMLLSKVDLPSH